MGTTCASACLTPDTPLAIFSALWAALSRSLSGAVTLTKTAPSFAEAFTPGKLSTKAASTWAAKARSSRAA